MATADIIQSMKTHITNAYNAIEEKGGTLPLVKNLNKLSDAINSIPVGGIEAVPTVTALKAKVTEENVGQIYRFTGTSSNGFESDELYGVVEDSGGGYSVLGLGKVTYNTTKYSITTNFTACGPDAYAMENMPLGGIITTDIMTGIGPYANYVLPDTITVSGCQYTWVLSSDKKNGTLTLYNATGNITVTITATSGAADYGSTPTYQGVWNLFGDCNFRDKNNSAAVFNDVEFMDAFISWYTETFDGSTTEWTDFISYLTITADIVKSVTKDMTEGNLNEIMYGLNMAWDAVGLGFKSLTTTVKEVMTDGCIVVAPIIGGNTYDLYLWLVPENAYAPLD